MAHDTGFYRYIVEMAKIQAKSQLISIWACAAEVKTTYSSEQSFNSPMLYRVYFNPFRFDIPFDSDTLD